MSRKPRINTLLVEKERQNEAGAATPTDILVNAIASRLADQLSNWLKNELDQRFTAIAEQLEAMSPQASMELIDAKTACSILNTSNGTLREWTKSGRLKPVRGGGRSGSNRYYLKSDIDAFIKESAQ